MASRVDVDYELLRKVNQGLKLHRRGIALKTLNSRLTCGIIAKLVSRIEKKWNGITRISITELQIIVGELRVYEHAYRQRRARRLNGQKCLTDFKEGER